MEVLFFQVQRTGMAFPDRDGIGHFHFRKQGFPDRGIRSVGPDEPTSLHGLFPVLIGYPDPDWSAVGLYPDQLYPIADFHPGRRRFLDQPGIQIFSPGQGRLPGQVLGPGAGDMNPVAWSTRGGTSTSRGMASKSSLMIC